MCRAVAREVRAGAVRGIALFVRGQVAKVSLHRCEVGLLLRVRELRDRDRGENADDDDDDQKLDQRETLFVADHSVSLSKRSKGGAEAPVGATRAVSSQGTTRVTAR